MDAQQQTGAEAQTQPQAQAPLQGETNGVLPFNAMVMPNPDAMVGVLPPEAFLPDQTMAALSMSDPSMMLPMMFANGQIPPQAEAKAISAGTSHPSPATLIIHN